LNIICAVAQRKRPRNFPQAASIFRRFAHPVFGAIRIPVVMTKHPSASGLLTVLRGAASAVLLASLAGISAAAQSDSRWSLSFGAGTELDSGNEFHRGPDGTFAGLPVDLQSRDYDDIFDSPTRLLLQLNYAASERLSYYGRFNYVEASGSTINIGTIATLPLFGTFSDYETWGFDVGAKYAFGSGAFRPFLSADVGFKVVDAISIGLRPGAATAAAAATPQLFKGSTEYLWGVGTGFDYAVSERIALGLEVGLRYEGGLRGDDRGFAGSGLERVNDTGKRWVFPVLVKATWSF